MQVTLKKEIVFSGRGLFTGEEAVVRLSPAPIGTGIVFYRTDLAQEIEATIENVQEGMRCTKIGKGKASVQTVEHLLAALKAFEIDNLRIEISGPEVPIFDGSSLPFVQMLTEAGAICQSEKKNRFRVSKPIYWSKGQTHLIALPSNTFQVSYTLHYPSYPGTQYYTLIVSKKGF